MNRIVVALPAYNEEKCIGSTVLQAREHASTVLVVDDGSTDKTAAFAVLTGAQVVKHERNLGYGAAIQTVIQEARRMKVDCLVVMDADYQHYAEDIPLLTEPVLSGDADVVIGRRQPDSIPRFRRVGQSVLSLFTRMVSGSAVRDTQSGFRAYSRGAVEKLQLKQNGMAASSEITAEAARIGLRVVEVPVRVRYDGDGSTHNPIAQGVHTLRKVLDMISEQKPLIFFGVTGGVLMIAGFTVGLRSYNMLMDTGVPPVGTMLVSVLLLTVGILSSFTGIILHTITRVLDRK